MALAAFKSEPDRLRGNGSARNAITDLLARCASEMTEIIGTRWLKNKKTGIC